MDVGGHVERGFEAVREAFVENFATHGDVGAACAVYLDGRPVVDLWGGIADDRTGASWQEGTLTLVYSTTKGVTAICAHHLAERAGLDLDATVASYWPEFAAAGKEQVTVRQLLSHRAGLPTLVPKLDRAEALAWDPAIRNLAAQEPMWAPGTTHGYHAVTYGWLVGEVIRRATGRSVGRYLADEIAGPLGLEFWIGLPASEEHRMSRLIPAPMMKLSVEELRSIPPEQLERFKAMADPDSLMQRALNPTAPTFNYNQPDLHAAELPAANGIGTARALARLYAATIGPVDGIRLLSDATVAAATVEQSNGADAVLGLESRFGSGFFLPSLFSPLMGPRSFGHSGAGGSLALADPDSGVGFAYVMNQMQQGLAADPRPASLLSALRSAIDK
ncbi:MAG TPA: serine hydrolase domain-containing protein [Acidimicrobiales bacterium]|jgi:CubicO group peptidase (beta-lactamase class C family)|nr:serine hydrolase domain-containing protein [Acidimicrobiales bacterium]